MRIDEKVFFGGCVSGFGIAGGIWRGWIVPVGGSTPDRLRSDRLRSDRLGPVQDGGEEMRIDEKVCFEGMSFWVWSRGGDLAGVDRSGRGFNPRPAQGLGFNPRPAQGLGGQPPTGIGATGTGPAQTDSREAALIRRTK